MIEEIWKAVVGHEGEYEVSNLGRIRSLDRSWEQVGRGGSLHTHHKLGQTLRPGSMTAGHQSVAIGRHNSKCVHDLVLRAFVGPPPAKHEARHLDGNEKNNWLTNLEWATRSRNTQDKKWHKGTKRYKLSPSDVNFIRLARKHRTVKIKELARLFNVCEGSINAIHSRVYHRDMPECR
jgi:hypothetical protein